MPIDNKDSPKPDTTLKYRLEITFSLLLIQNLLYIGGLEGKQDLNSKVERIFCSFLNTLFGWKLENLNVTAEGKSANYPAIDLGDRANRIAVQISTDRSKRKLQNTLNTFIRHEQYKDYDYLYFLDLGYDGISSNTKPHFHPQIKKSSKYLREETGGERVIINYYGLVIHLPAFVPGADDITNPPPLFDRYRKWPEGQYLTINDLLKKVDKKCEKDSNSLDWLCNLANTMLAEAKLFMEHMPDRFREAFNKIEDAIKDGNARTQDLITANKNEILALRALLEPLLQDKRRSSQFECSPLDDYSLTKQIPQQYDYTSSTQNKDTFHPITSRETEIDYRTNNQTDYLSNHNESRIPYSEDNFLNE